MTNSDTGKDIIKKEIPLIAKLPGVYKMLNEKNEVLYVGKAKNLPNRLKVMYQRKIILLELRECYLKLENLK